MKFINKCLMAVLALAASAEAQVGNRRLVVDTFAERQYVITATDIESVESLIHQYGGAIMHKYEAILTGVAATAVSPALLGALKGHPNVTSVDQDLFGGPKMVGSMRGLTDESWTTQTGADLSLDRLDQSTLPLDGKYTYSGNGTGVKVFVLDCGIRLTHADFGGRATCGLDVTMGTPYQESDIPCDPIFGHGTHVAGLVGGAKSGVAKNVDLISVKVATYADGADYAAILKGFDYVAKYKRDNPSQPCVAILAYGGKMWQPLDDGANTLVEKFGVSLVIAAGNEEKNACMGTPGRAKSALTIGASCVGGDPEFCGGPMDSAAVWSNFGNCVDLYAPGDLVLSAWNRNDTDFRAIDGTSMSAPLVAGAVALYLEKEPTLTPAQIAAKLKNDALKDVLTNVPGNTPNLLLHVNNNN